MSHVMARAACFGLFAACAAVIVPAVQGAGAAHGARVFAVTIRLATTPHVDAPHVRTRGKYPLVAGSGVDLRHVNKVLTQTVLSDEREYAAAIPKEEASARRTPGNYGIYETIPWQRLGSASSVVVSWMIPTLTLLPAGVDGQWWLAVTVRVSDARRIRIADLFLHPHTGLSAVATAAKKRLVARNACVRASLADAINGSIFADGFAPTPRNYQYFALTPHGLAIGFPVGQVAGPPCGRTSAMIPYAALIPYFSDAGKDLIYGVREPRSG